MAQALAQSSQSSTDGKVSRAVEVQEGRGSCCVHAEPAVWAAALVHSLMLVVKDLVTVAAAACCLHNVEAVSHCMHSCSWSVCNSPTVWDPLMQCCLQ